MSRQITILIFLSFFALILRAQHEGIERHFRSYTIDIIPSDDFSYYDDTLTDRFHLFLPQQKISEVNLGFMNPGTPFITALYSCNPTHEFSFFKYYYPFIQTHNSFVYFDAKQPFTLFRFRGGGKINEYTGFLHTQNINPNLNFAFNYDVINSDGLYQYNASKVHSLGFGTAYTKHKYQSYFNFIFNKITHRDNGGIKNEEIFESGRYRSDLLDVNLYNASTKLGQVGVFYSQEYRVGKYSVDTIIMNADTLINKTVDSKLSFIHELSADRYYRVYSDKPSSFYKNIYLDSLKTYDSLCYKTLNNKFLVNFDVQGNGKINLFRFYAGVINYVYNYNTIGLKQTYLSNYVIGNLSFSVPKIDFNANMSYCFFGTDIFDTNLSANLKWNFYKENSLNIFLFLSRLNPDIFKFYYNSNHFKWDLSEVIKKQNNLTTGGNFILTKYKIDLGVKFNLLQNYIIYDYDALPLQISQLNIITEAYLKKIFNVKIFYWDNSLTYQYILNRSLIPLPAFVAYSSFYFKSFLFHKNMILQLGLDLKFHSATFTYAYMPAIGEFYLQQNRKLGNYPNFGFHLVAKVKRLRAFVKISNFNSLFMPNTYYLLYKIPDNPFSLNFGISWEFYD